MPAPPYCCGTETPSSPSVRHPAENAIAIEMVLAIVLADVRRDFPRAPLAHRLLEQAVFVGESRSQSWQEGSDVQKR